VFAAPRVLPQLLLRLLRTVVRRRHCSQRRCPACTHAHAGISAIPRGFGELRALEGLQAEGCPLAQPYAALYAKKPLLLVALHDTSLLALDLSDCGLTAVPPPLLAQTQLTALNLSRNGIKQLPVGLGALRQLRQLGLKGNPLGQPYMR
jgi:Leucine-rich repeat (LRR) protein